MSADDILMRLLLEQVDASGFKFDYEALSQALGTKKNAAFMRVSRLKARLAASAGASGKPICIFFVPLRLASPCHLGCVKSSDRELLSFLPKHTQLNFPSISIPLFYLLQKQEHKHPLCK